MKLWTFSCGTKAGHPKQASWTHLTRSGSQSKHRIRFILPSRRFIHIICQIITKFFFSLRFGVYRGIDWRARLSISISLLKSHLALLYYKKFGLPLFKNQLLVRTCDVFLHLVAISFLDCILSCYRLCLRVLLVIQNISPSPLFGLNPLANFS